MQKHLIILCGPTGIGKTKVAIEVAKNLGCEIISADSRQLFKEMRIGTAVPARTELHTIQHHFIQSHSIHKYYNASMYEEEVIAFLTTYFEHHNKALLVGGSGLYIDAVCKGIDELPTILPDIREKWKKFYDEKGLEFIQEKVKEIDPDYYNVVDKKNPKRLIKAIEVNEMTGKSYSSFLTKTKKERTFCIVKIGLNTDREILYQKINRRVDVMMKKGLLKEAKKLHPFKQLTPLKTVGYKELFAHLEGQITLEEAVEQIKNHSRAYARRQLTWFRRDKEIEWFDPEEINQIISFTQSKINP
jgi:tRNA dimethylallyltransferase